uniref:Uncharacterized protein n=1 Tax=Biomphalaria glabrata TaxID=6526 RepID=A0A2C9L5Y1_BIOGL
MPGFRHPIMHCTDACGEMTYGAECTGDCAKKCAGQDCIERVEGTCPSQSIWRSNWWLVALVLLIIPIIILARVSGRKAREQYEIAEAIEIFGGEDNADNVEVTQSEISKPKSLVSQQTEISRIFESKTSLSTSV